MFDFSLGDIVSFFPSFGPISDHILKWIIKNPLNAGVAFVVLLQIFGFKLMLGMARGPKALIKFLSLLALMIIIPMYYFLFMR